MVDSYSGFEERDDVAEFYEEDGAPSFGSEFDNNDPFYSN